MEISQLIKTHHPKRDDARRPLHILFVTSEVAPYSKTGGLGDVSASLPLALAGLGHHVTILTPRYRHIDADRLRLSKRLRALPVPTGTRGHDDAHIWEGALSGRVRLLFLDHAMFSERDGLYGYDGDDFEDNAARFAFFARAAVEVAHTASMPYDVVHCQDWHTALAPVYARHSYAKELDKVAFVTTIHNLAFQGRFTEASFAALGLPKRKYFTPAELAVDGQVNFLKGGLQHSDRVTTVSPTYVQEIKTEQGGFGLDATLRERGDKLTGILNGVDYEIWSPQRDREIPVRYDLQNLNGKRRNKTALQHKFGLPVRPTAPLLGFVGRLTEQKGLDILLPALRNVLRRAENDPLGPQVVFLGDGQGKYQKELETLRRDFPRHVGVHLGYEESIAHFIQAGSDMLLVPSRFEPCGLSQIYALRYGTLPLVHATGGLADTVTDADASDAIGTGFSFSEFSQDALERTILRATERFTHMRQWRPLMVTAMHQDFSWSESARQYEDVFRAAMADRGNVPAKPVVVEAAPVEAAPVEAPKAEKKPARAPKAAPKAEPVVEVAAPVAEVVEAEPTKKPSRARKPKAEPVIEAAPAVEAEPAKKPSRSRKPKAEPVVEAAPAVEAPKAAKKPAAKPKAKADKPAAKVEEPKASAAEPAKKPAAKPKAKPAAKAAEAKAEEPKAEEAPRRARRRSDKDA
jgi:starch synthase